MKTRLDRVFVVLAGLACACGASDDGNGKSDMIGSGGAPVPSGGSGGTGAGINPGSNTPMTMMPGVITGSGGRSGGGMMMMVAGSGGKAGGSGGVPPTSAGGDKGGGDPTGAAGMGGGAAGMGGGTSFPPGMCCSSGDCICHGDAPTELTSRAGPYKVDTIELSTGTVYYPTDAEPPLSAIAICPGFLNTGPEMGPWGPFYASNGFVLIAAYTGAADVPDIRAGLLLAAIDELKKENMKSGSPLEGKLAGRFGTSGYSMGGGGTTIAASQDSSLKTSIGLAPWGGTGAGTTVPSLMFCGDADTVAPSYMAQGVYDELPDMTPKMIVTVFGATHFNWFDPADAGGGLSGQYALAFQKVYLDGDERWKSLLVQKPMGNGMMETNIQ